MDAQNNASPGFAKNPDKVIAVEPVDATVVVRAGDGVVVARSTRAQRLSEPPYPSALYIPFEDISFKHLKRTAHSSHCPYKGHASYWSVTPAGDKGKNAMWAYEAPYDEMRFIADHGAFSSDRVTIEAA